MGNELSSKFTQARTETDVPSEYNNIEIRNKIIASWSPEKERNKHKAYMDAGKTTLPATSVWLAAMKFNAFFSEIIESKLNVLEVFAGNCQASKVFIEEAKPLIGRWICTDIAKYTIENNKNTFTFDQLHAVAAVDKYGADADILLMICPPYTSYGSETQIGGDSYADYYACYDFIAQARRVSEPKFIVFVGEVGGADGSSGMYKYLLCNKDLDVKLRVEVNQAADIFGGICSRELIILLIKPQ